MLTSSGEVLTNNHVVNGATSVQVVDVGNGRTYTATVVGTDRPTTSRCCSCRAHQGSARCTVGNSANVAVGDAVAAFGNAGGVGGTPSIASGHITGLGQSITAYDDVTGTSENLDGLIQTDAAIQPGDSGGPLVDSRGQVIGMDTAASSSLHFRSQTSTAGFAIPINKALSIASQIEHGSASGNIHIGPQAFLGVQISQTQAVATPGVAISDTIPNEPAAGIGMQPGDVITAVDGVAVTTPDQLTREMQKLHPGQSGALAWVDGSDQRQITSVTLAPVRPRSRTPRYSKKNSVARMT